MDRTQPPQLNRRGLVAGGSAALAALATSARSAETDGFRYEGRLVQGGYLIGHSTPGAAVSLNGEAMGVAGSDGVFVIGFDRDEAPTAVVSVREGRAPATQRRVAIGPVAYDVQRINGLPADQVEPSDPALLARIAAEAALKARALASVDDSDGFRNGFIRPVAYRRISARFGGQRILNGVPQRPHYGIDLAAPVGTPIVAPAPGLVVLAEPAMHFDGGITMIDHGQGLVGMFLHQSAQYVRAGDRVEQGQRIGLVGQTGRVTGPHLCWRMKWRTKNMDPSLMVPVGKL